MKLIDYFKQKKQDTEYRIMQKLTRKYFPKDIELSEKACEVVKVCAEKEYIVGKDPSLWAALLNAGKDAMVKALAEELKPYIKFTAEGNDSGDRLTFRASIEIVKR